MRLSSLADYAVVTMSAAARHPVHARLSATNLAGEIGVPLPTVQKLMGHLVRAGLLTSARGTGGGFLLARSADAISLAEIIEAIEGPIAMTKCVEGHVEECQLHGSCLSKPHLQAANRAVRGALAGVSLATLATHTTVRPEPVEGPSFFQTRMEKQGFDKLSPNGVVKAAAS